MLEHTFCHVPRVTVRSESKLWDAGVLSWEDALNGDLPKIARVNRDEVLRVADESVRELKFGNLNYFSEHMPSAQHWRFFPEFRDRAAYLDIETTGMGGAGHGITTIALYDGREIKTYIRGRDLQRFVHDIGDYDLLVTFNGKSFDIPFIENEFGIELRHAQIDLRHVLRRLGYTGGLKSCEHQLGLSRGKLDGVDGSMAVALWRDYKRNLTIGALDTLLAYNIADVLSLETLLVKAYNMEVEKTPFAKLRKLPLPKPPRNPLKPDPDVMRRLTRDYSWKLDRERTA
jgi:uncharacterized protein